MDWSRRQFFGAAGLLTLSQAALLKAQSQRESADLVLFNSKIFTVDDAFSIRQAIAIEEVSAAAPLYLRSQGRLTLRAIGISILALLAMGAALLGSLYPVPAREQI